ncbi:hypothetical protein FQN57_003376 [Myotisia sp. PD_48]|nr:hypothetical protein FQN57_003376 [Myotisia sp. PD_48]
MSKRAAQGQGKKETGLDFEMATNPNELPKRATAAQLANRKIKAARERKPRAGSPSFGQQPTNPFDNINPNVAPTPFSTGTANGLSFGQSQSFSQPVPNNTQSSFTGDQNNSSNFFGQSTSAPSSFSFSAANANESVKNPFASMPSAPQNQSTGFQGFKGSLFNAPPTGNNNTGNVPASQSTPSGGMFAATGNGIFGQKPASSPFGASSTPTPSPAPTFGQSNGTNMFGKSGTTSNMFGTQPANDSSAMQMSPENAKSTSQGMFNIAAPSQPSFTSPFSASGTGFNSGTSTSQPQPSSAAPSWSFQSSTTTTPPIFGGSSKPTETTTATPAPSTGMFGASIASSFSGFGSKPEEKSNTPPLFGASNTAETKPATTAPPSTNMFGASTPSSFSGFTSKPQEKPNTPAFFGGSKPTDPVTTAPPSTNMFGASMPSSFSGFTSKPQEKPNAPALFGGSSNPTEANSATTAPPSTNMFGASMPSSFSGFTSKPQQTPSTPTAFSASTATPTQIPDANKTPSFFGASTPSTQSNFSLFGPGKQDSEKPSISSPAPTKPGFSILDHASQSQNNANLPANTGANQPIFSLFGQSNRSKETEKPSQGPESSAASPAPKPVFSAFGQTPSQGSVNFAAASTAPAASQSVFSNFGQSGQAQESSKTPAIKETAPTPQNSFFAPTTSTFSPAAAGNSFFGDIAKPTAAPEANNKITFGNFGPSSKVSATPQPAFGFKPSTPSTPSTAPLSPQKPTAPQASMSFTPVPQSKPFAAVNGVSLAPKPKYVDASTETKFPVQVELSDLRPSEAAYPPNATEEERAEILQAWRLATLNESFQQEIAQVDCWTADIDPIVAHYVMLRKMIGHPHPLVTVYEPIPEGCQRPWKPENPFAEQDERDRQRRANLQAAKGKSKAVQSPARTNKRKAPESGEQEAGSSPTSGKRSRIADSQPESSMDETDSANEEPASETLTLFASSFVAQKSRASNSFSVPEAEEETSSDESEESEGEEAEDKGRTTTPSLSPPASRNGGGRSLFDRVERDESGQPKRQIEEEAKSEAPAKETETESASSSIFNASKIGSPFNIPRSSTPLFSFTGSANGTGDSRSPSPFDPTKVGTSPPASIFSGLAPTAGTSMFAGTPTFGSTPSPSNGSLAPPSATTNIFAGLQSSTDAPSSSLLSPAPLSAPTSIEASRSATPVQSDTGGDDETEKHAQVDFTRGGPGEEDEDPSFESRSRAYKMVDGGWKVQGVGLLRILKHRDTNKSRVILRADPSGKLVLNVNLIPDVEYKQRQNSVMFAVPTKSGIEHWMLRVKEEPKAAELAELMETSKKVST